MADEMEMPELGSDRPRKAPRLPTARRLPRRGAVRKLTKNTDHQTVPRFEQLVDLGFLRKQGSELEVKCPRRHWVWAPTDACLKWTRATRNSNLDVNFLWQGFAAAVAAVRSHIDTRSVTEPEEVAELTWEAYSQVKRPFGHTPLDSVALRAMVDSASVGRVLEMRGIHRLMRCLKATSIASDHASFAGGNELDQMFVRLRDGFVQSVLDAKDHLGEFFSRQES